MKQHLAHIESIVANTVFRVISSMNNQFHITAPDKISVHTVSRVELLQQRVEIKRSSHDCADEGSVGCSSTQFRGILEE